MVETSNGLSKLLLSMDLLTYGQYMLFYMLIFPKASGQNNDTHMSILCVSFLVVFVFFFWKDLKKRIQPKDTSQALNWFQIAAVILGLANVGQYLSFNSNSLLLPYITAAVTGLALAGLFLSTREFVSEAKSAVQLHILGVDSFTFASVFSLTLMSVLSGVSIELLHSQRLFQLGTTLHSTILVSYLLFSLNSSENKYAEEIDTVVQLLGAKKEVPVDPETEKARVQEWKSQEQVENTRKSRWAYLLFIGSNMLIYFISTLLCFYYGTVRPNQLKEKELKAQRIR